MHHLAGSLLGGLMKPQWILTLSTYFHTIRLFGGNVGALYMAHFLDDREKLHSNLLQVSSGKWITDANIHAMTAGVFGKFSGISSAGARAVDLVAARLRLQAYTLSLIDGFLLVAWTCAIALLLVALVRKSPFNNGDLSKLQPVKEAHS